MFERFSDRARRVVVLAQEEARLLNHNYIGTEHILLGLIHEGEGVAANALESLDVSLEAVRVQVEDIIGHGGSAPSGHIPFTPRAKKVLELSLREALQLGHNYIGTEHVLLGLIREGEGVAAQVLVRLGADLSRVRQRVIQILSGLGTEAQTMGHEVLPQPERSVARSAGIFRPAVRSESAPQCSFCRRDLAGAEHYATGLHATICSECITAAHTALATTADEQTVLILPPRTVGSPPPDDPGAAGKIAAAFHAVFGRTGPGSSDDLEDGAQLMPRFERAFNDFPADAHW